MPVIIVTALLLAIPSSGGPLEAVGLQAALDRAGFSPGLIDGGPGTKTQTAIEAFQRFKGLTVTGRADAATRAALEVDSQPAVMRYVITRADAADVAPPPPNWSAKSKVDRLRYPSLAALVGERGHCTRWLLAKLNPGVDLDRLKVGDALVIPNVAPATRMPSASSPRLTSPHPA